MWAESLDIVSWAETIMELADAELANEEPSQESRQVAEILLKSLFA